MKGLHKQTWIKVNTHVDEGICELIQCLSAFPKIETIESCEGDANTPAWVCFYCGDYWLHPWHDLAEFVFEYLGPALAHELGDRVDIIVRVTECGQIHGELEIRPGAMGATIQILKKLLRSYMETIPSRMYGCSYDNENT